MNPKPNVRYQHFTFPFEVIHAGLHQLVAAPPSRSVPAAIAQEEHKREQRLLAWLEDQAESERRSLRRKTGSGAAGGTG